LAPEEYVLTKGTHIFNYHEMKPFDWNEEKNKWLKRERENEYTYIAKRSEAPQNKGNGRRDAVSNPGFKHHS
jgi:hypothetical protein